MLQLQQQHDYSPDNRINNFVVPSLDIELQVSVNATVNIRLRCVLPPGYPELCPATVSAVTMLDPGILRRGQQTELRERLTEKLNDLVGSEAIMELVQELQDTITELLLVQQEQERQIDNNSCDDDNELDETGSATKGTESDGFGRRWIWAHHITDRGRCKSIIQEAKSLQLGGFLKSGYPGIVVVEGTIPNCNEFVQWIKGSKSRPGGFGRNWGHHVKGEINHDSKTAPCLPDNFQELSEDMAVLGAKCKEHGLETEFREYVLQHKNQV
jgi:hypothetical protein